jgi:hypothetical protein
MNDSAAFVEAVAALAAERLRNTQAHSAQVGNPEGGQQP